LTDIPVDPSFLRFDVWVMFSCAIVLWIFVLTKGTIGRLTGGIFLAGYFSYLAMIY
jgi:cation:H+ antiporter